MHTSTMSIGEQIELYNEVKIDPETGEPPPAGHIWPPKIANLIAAVRQAKAHRIATAERRLDKKRQAQETERAKRVAATEPDKLKPPLTVEIDYEMAVRLEKATWNNEWNCRDTDAFEFITRLAEHFPSILQERDDE